MLGARAHTHTNTHTRQTHFCLTCFGDFGSPDSSSVAPRRSKHGGRAVWQRVRLVYKVSTWAPIGLREVWLTPQTLGHRAASQTFISCSGCLPVESRRSEVKETSCGTLMERLNCMRLAVKAALCSFREEIQTQSLNISKVIQTLVSITE